jgi:hypothetical protein
MASTLVAVLSGRRTTIRLAALSVGIINARRNFTITKGNIVREHIVFSFVGHSGLS